MLTDALAPYAGAIKVVAYAICMAILLSMGAYAGCSYKKSEVQDIAKDRDYWKTQSETNASAINEANRQVLANKQFAKEQLALAEAANKAAEEQKKKNAEQAEQFQKRLAEARRNPDCKTVLEMDLCPMLRDY